MSGSVWPSTSTTSSALRLRYARSATASTGWLLLLPASAYLSSEPRWQASFVYASPTAKAVLGLTPAELDDFAARPQQFMRSDDLQKRLAIAVGGVVANLTPYRGSATSCIPSAARSGSR